MIRSVIDPIAKALGYVRRPLTIRLEESPPVPFTRSQIDNALNMGFVMGFPHDCSISTFGTNNQDMKIVLVFRHREAK